MKIQNSKFKIQNYLAYAAEITAATACRAGMILLDKENAHQTNGGHLYYVVGCAYTKISCITIYTGSNTISEKRNI